MRSVATVFHDTNLGSRPECIDLIAQWYYRVNSDAVSRTRVQPARDSKSDPIQWCAHGGRSTDVSGSAGKSSTRATSEIRDDAIMGRGKEGGDLPRVTARRTMNARTLMSERLSSRSHSPNHTRSLRRRLEDGGIVLAKSREEIAEERPVRGTKYVYCMSSTH